jgi:predicted metalloendopeptidase
MRQRIAALAWMSAPTRAQARAKLDAMVAQIGAPQVWPDYSGLDLRPDDYAGNHLRLAAWATARDLAQLGRPVDRLRWTTSPHIVNAFAAGGNRIVFPAGILQPPFFDPLADDATNYGAIGSVIGHEITHHFDDRGRQFDADGNLRDWWTKDDSDRFDALAHKVVEQYDGYVAVDTLHLNGKLTLGENIADLGGITIAYHAWKRSLKGKPAPVIDGFTGEQRFFLGTAQAWRRKYRPEMARMQALSDPHSTAEWRVNGPLSNMPEFRQAFGCQAGDPMVRGEQVVIW